MSGSGGSLGGEVEPGPTDSPGHASQPGERREVGNAASSRLHPPHVTEQVKGEPVQGSSPSPHPAPTLPANAHGVDAAEMTDQPAVRQGSMYENRPEEDKDQPPSQRAR